MKSTVSPRYPKLEQVGERRWKTLSNIIVDSDILSKRLVIRSGFHTDLASVPQILWALIPPHGEYSCAAIAHDYLYQNHLVSRADADRLFKELMVSLKASKWRLWLMWAGVRLGGWKPFREKR